MSERETPILPETEAPEPGPTPQPDKLERLFKVDASDKNYDAEFLKNTQSGDFVYFRQSRQLKAKELNKKGEELEPQASEFFGQVVDFDKDTKSPIIEVGKDESKKRVKVSNLRQAINYSWLFDRDGWERFLEGLNPEEQADFISSVKEAVAEVIEEGRQAGEEDRRIRREEEGIDAHLAERKKDSRKGERRAEDQQIKWQNLLNQEVEFKQKGKTLSGKLVGYNLDSYGSIGKIEIRVEPGVGKKRDIYLVKKKDLIGLK